MIDLMMEMKYKAINSKYDNSLGDMRRAIAKAKLSILAVENQLELGSVPSANLEQAQKYIGLAVHESEKLAIYDEAMKFYGEAAIA